MQTLQVIKTVRWLESLITKETKELVFNWGLLSAQRPGDTTVRTALRASHELASFATKGSANSHAVKVLDAFALAQLTTSAFSERLAFAVWGSVAKDRPPGVGSSELHEAIGDVSRNWDRMIACIGPIEKLTTTPELQEPEPSPAIVSMELHYLEGDGVELQTLAKAVELIEKAYASIAEVYEVNAGGQLRIVKVESGSSIRLDCRGLGEPIKHFKDFLLEAWHKLRHQMAEDVTVNNAAVLSSLSVLREVKKREQSGDLPPENAELLRRAVVESTLGLFHRGVLPAEVTDVEIVDNVTLLGHFNPKLLTDGVAGAASSGQSGPTRKTSRKRKPRPKPGNGTDGSTEKTD